MTAENVLENLKDLIGAEPMELHDLSDAVVCAFEDFEECGETYVMFEESHNSGYDYSAYINAEDSTIFCLAADKEWSEENKCFMYSITNVWTY